MLKFILLYLLLTISSVFAQQKCINYFCDGLQKPDPTCQFGYKRTLDYGATYRCVEDLLKEKYSGCTTDGGTFMTIGNPVPIQPGYVKVTPYDKDYFSCFYNFCLTEALLSGNSFYCPEKVDQSCSLGRKITTDAGSSYQCLENSLSTRYNCFGQLKECSWPACQENSIAYQPLARGQFGKEVRLYYYCVGNGCGEDKMKKTSWSFVCADPACTYTQEYAWPSRNYPLEWVYSSIDKKWVCEASASSSKCGDIQVKERTGIYYCAPKRQDCYDNVLVPCKECDASRHDCFEDYPGWCCVAPKSELMLIYVIVAPIFVLIGILIFCYNRNEKQKKLQRTLQEGSCDYSFTGK